MTSTSIEVRSDALRIRFDDGHVADFHWFWLRRQCAHERHPRTGEPTLCPSRVPLDVRPEAAWLEEEQLAVRWGELRPPSLYALAWLRAHAYGRADAPPPPRDVARYEVAVRASDGSLPDDWRERLARDGAFIARGAPAWASPAQTERWIDELEGRGLRLVETHFGRVEDLRTDNTTNRNTDQLGYTDAAIDLHTDQPFIEAPPRYQLLHAVRSAERGGDSLLADGWAAAAWLRAQDEETYEQLTETPVRFHRRQRQFESVVEAPILAVSDDGSIHVRASYFTLAPCALPFSRQRAFHRAYARWVALLEEFHVRTRLEPGDLLLYDNHRMLHGRASFEGARWVRGVYFDRVEHHDDGTVTTMDPSTA